MFRIKMNLENPNTRISRNIAPKNSVLSKPVTNATTRNMSLNTPMIDRVHKAKSGCSACGKKVA